MQYLFAIFLLIIFWCVSPYASACPILPFEEEAKQRKAAEGLRDGVELTRRIEYRCELNLFVFAEPYDKPSYWLGSFSNSIYPSEGLRVRLLSPGLGITGEELQEVQLSIPVSL